MKNVFYKMYSTLGTIVLNIEYNAAKRSVQLYSMLNLFFLFAFFLLLLFVYIIFVKRVLHFY